MSKKEETSPSTKDDGYYQIPGYVSGKCDLCTYEILVKSGDLKTGLPAYPTFVRWFLCNVCRDKGWQIPKYSPQKQTLTYSNTKTTEN